MTASGVGRRIWAIPGGHIPLRSTGPEPERTSRDELFILNSGDAPARISLTIFYANREPVTGYTLTVGARRVRSVRFNDLIDPEAMPLDVDYGVLIVSDVPVVVQFSRIDTSGGGLAMLGTIAYPVESG